ncbi:MULTISPECIES: hypothetical protein [Pseudothermotoga]|jgi:hypothetical protein|uniref:Uncharacterized protein n=1 Tax=Pseudothermotoga lettingae (strain ATCC BAA-301 / DSM 14385 / NBRC 107922 / TMO) TaxID=416591 RepID=A8F8A9_PSELT|nr:MULTISPECIES: hypothetical protein [Pseudothermotoga]ABV34393.1 hypothetical protein Tlet_1839 [Pseudothermotoga lettingae TMO]KUK20390.1 MAG: Uncharacterized protein XD56_1688 [Pseudothermotoga lettingae]MDI3494362.1 hypothetical protein [Pseudothermotoga sp.]MDK2883661.1 hypothetical protein [Pseudothermotoga sp.]GLI48662.1 hypothetical protein PLETTINGATMO_08310 [Pseudothermotoga lettingae TMO]
MKKAILILLVLLSITLLGYEAEMNFLNYRSIIYRIVSDEEMILTGFETKRINGKYEVTQWTKFTVDEGQDVTFEQVAASYLAIAFGYIYNPAFQPFFQMIDLDNPTTLNMYNIKIVYEGDEKVAGYVGRKFSYYVDDELQMTWVVSKQIELVLKVIIPTENYTVELVSFEKW